MERMVWFSSSSRRNQGSPILRNRGIKIFCSHWTAYLLQCLGDGKQCSIIPKNCPQHLPGSSSICARKSQVDTSACHNNTLLVHKELEQKPYSVTYYSDSKVVLGYISNESRRFYVYISNCVERIRRSLAPHQWKYVATNLNPSDPATRSIEASKLKESTWHRGPKFLNNSLTTVTDDRDTDAEIFSDDPEVRKDLNVSATHVEVCSTIGSERFSRFSEWSKLQGAIAKLITFACMSTRAVHIEIIESMDTSSFINALCRFLAIRGPVIQLCSDCGTNFVGARNKLQAVLKPSDASPVKRYLLKEGCE